MKEECDSPMEYFYDEKEQKLYYNFNSTSGPTGSEQWVAPQAQMLFNISGSIANAVRNITIRGLLMRDTAYTSLGTTQVLSGI